MLKYTKYPWFHSTRERERREIGKRSSNKRRKQGWNLHNRKKEEEPSKHQIGTTHWISLEVTREPIPLPGKMARNKKELCIFPVFPLRTIFYILCVVFFSGKFIIKFYLEMWKKWQNQKNWSFTVPNVMFAPGHGHQWWNFLINVDENQTDPRDQADTPHTLGLTTPKNGTTDTCEISHRDKYYMISLTRGI